MILHLLIENRRIIYHISKKNQFQFQVVIVIQITDFKTNIYYKSKKFKNIQI